MFRGLVLLCSLSLGWWCWFSWTSPSFISIPASVDGGRSVPCVDVEIGEKSYRVELDLGAEFSTLYEQDLCEIDKRPCGSYSSFDVHGNKYKRAMYEVLGAKIHELKIPRMTILEESADFAKNTSFGENSKKAAYCGRIGREIFDGRNFLLDFASSKVIFCGSFNDLARDRYNLKNFIKVPFQMNRVGICLRVETDLGEQILLLDTGSSHCLLRPPKEKEQLVIEASCPLPIWRSQKFSLGGCEFGPMGIMLLELTPLMNEIDGILGMDFLKEHAIYIDKKKSVAYIAKSPTKSPCNAPSQ